MPELAKPKYEQSHAPKSTTVLYFNGDLTSVDSVNRGVRPYRSVRNPNPYELTDRGVDTTTDESQTREATGWISRLPISLVLVSVGIVAIAAHELTISKFPWGEYSQFVTFVWCGFSLSAIGSGIGFLSNRRFGLILGAFFGPIILWVMLAAALYLYLEIRGEKLFGD